ncbi:hypothetical protein JZU69_01515 [bacterium]|nr:hypothetical protein [bacterium]
MVLIGVTGVLVTMTGVLLDFVVEYFFVAVAAGKFTKPYIGLLVGLLVASSVLVGKLLSAVGESRAGVLERWTLAVVVGLEFGTPCPKT